MTVLELTDRFYSHLTTVDADEALCEVMDWDERTVPWWAYDMRSGLVRVLRERLKAERKVNS